MRSRRNGCWRRPWRAGSSTIARPTEASRRGPSCSTTRPARRPTRSPASSTACSARASSPRLRGRTRAGGVTTESSAVRTRRCACSASRPRRWLISPACGVCRDPARGSGGAGSHRSRPRHDARGRGGRGYRQDERARAADRRAAASGRAQVERIVAVTFTDAAAGELKLRVRAAIEEARHAADTDPAARKHLTEALPALEEARIGTIHGLCADLLREWPVEAGVDPAFEVAAEDAASELKDAAFDRWFERQLAAPGPAMRRVLARAASSRSDGPRARLRSAVDELVERRDFPAPWRRAPFDRDGEMTALVAEMAGLGALAASGARDNYLTRSLEELKKFADEVARREAVRGKDPDGLEAALVGSRAPFLRHWNWSGSQNARHRFQRAEVIARRAALAARIDTFIARTGADLAPALRDALWDVVEDYGERKRRAGVLDFLDLLLAARKLVRERPDVRSALQRRFTHLLVDEFQDTDPLQAELLLLLAADDPATDDWRRVRVVPGKLFVVGDPKQSIYRFRRADVALYEAVKQQLAAAGGATVELTVRFRALR